MSRARKYRKNRRASGTPRPNPGIVADLARDLLPAVAGFVGSRLTTRMVTLMVAKKWPRFAQHAGAIWSVGLSAAAYFGADKIKSISKYQEGIFIGTSLATVATVVQSYIPALGWMFAEVRPAELAPPQDAEQLTAGDYGNPYGGEYNDAFDAGRYSPPATAPTANAPRVAAAAAAAASPEVAQADAALDDLMAELGADEGGGIFGAAN